MSDQEAIIEATATALGLEMVWEFVPFSQSRNKGEKYPSLNYRVSLRKGARPILTTDYGMGCAHAPSYKMRSVVADRIAERVAAECETGYEHKRFLPSFDKPMKTGKKQIAPKFADVIYSLVMDSEVIDYEGFEDWASNFGYDADSRSAEKTYRACLEIALKLRNGLGEEGLAKLREACEGY